jgi:hypothetical protein
MARSQSSTFGTSTTRDPTWVNFEQSTQSSICSVTIITNECSIGAAGIVPGRLSLKVDDPGTALAAPTVFPIGSPGNRFMEDKVVFATPWFELVAKHPAGYSEPHYSIRTQDYVMVIATTVDGRLLLVRQFRPAVGEKTLEFPSGHVERGETPLQAARKELDIRTVGESLPRHRTFRQPALVLLQRHRRGGHGRRLRTRGWRGARPL